MEKAARRILERLRRHGHESLFAGGWVRDRLLGRPADDIDIATSAHPDEVLALFPNSIAIGARFGVVQARAYGCSFDVTTFRTEGPYLDGRHPSSVVFTDAKQDALRRDFTVNGLFYDPVAGRLIDYVGGRADLRSRILRAIGSAPARFDEDRLRMLRAVRLACKLGFQIEPATWSAVRNLAPAITSVSPERVRDELLKLLTGPDRSRGLSLLRESRLLDHIVPELTDVVAVSARALGVLKGPSPELALATLLCPTGEDAARRISRRLRLPNSTVRSVAALVVNHARLEHARDMRGSALHRVLGGPDVHDQLELLRASSIARGRSLDEYRFCVRTLRQLRLEASAGPLLTGSDLIGLGYKPGPRFREILDAVEDLRLERLLQTREEALEYVHRAYPKNPFSPQEGAQ